jgi:hypothetical protein
VKNLETRLFEVIYDESLVGVLESIRIIVSKRLLRNLVRDYGSERDFLAIMLNCRFRLEIREVLY